MSAPRISRAGLRDLAALGRSGPEHPARAPEHTNLVGALV
jgi:hypothetical protein